jgi:hypothetical protein
MTAGEARIAANGRAVGLLPMDCPYYRETLQDAPRGWVCCRCRSTVGADLGPTE